MATVQTDEPVVLSVADEFFNVYDRTGAGQMNFQP